MDAWGLRSHRSRLWAECACSCVGGASACVSTICIHWRESIHSHDQGSVCVCVFVHAGPTWCAADTWHFHPSAHFNNFTRTNEWISFHRSYFIRERWSCVWCCALRCTHISGLLMMNTQTKARAEWDMAITERWSRWQFIFDVSTFLERLELFLQKQQLKFVFSFKCLFMENYLTSFPLRCPCPQYHFRFHLKSQWSFKKYVKWEYFQSVFIHF